MGQAGSGPEWFSKELVETLPTAVYVCDMDAVVVAFNTRASELWGRTPRLGDLDQKFCGAHQLFRPDGASLPHCETPMAAVLRTGLPAADQEVIVERPDGSRISILVNIAPLFDAAGVQTGAVNCFQDLTAQKLGEIDRNARADGRRQAHTREAMGHLVGGVAHDFNNLLTPILGTLDLLLRRGSGNVRETKLIDGALQSAERARNLVQRLLAFARRQPLKSLVVDVATFLLTMEERIRSTMGSHVEVVMHVQHGLSAARLDAAQVELAIMNLSSNSNDAMPAGGTLTISAAEIAIGTDNDMGLVARRYIALCVSDDGTGMDADTLARSIEPFFSTKGVGKGSGLGLSMADGLASQLGGALTLTSELLRGTTVTLLLPTCEACAVTSPILAPVPDRHELRGRILLVDDEPLVRASTADMLADLGYEVIEANSAEQAKEVLDVRHDIDGIVTDHLMPGMSGVDLAGWLRERKSQVPILLVSGFAGFEGIASDLPMLAKPFRQASLAQSMADLLKAPLRLEGQRIN